MNYIKPPALSTSFSESGKNAKKRFANILNTKAKKTGAIAFAAIVVLVGIVGVMVTSNTASDKDEYIAAGTKPSVSAQDAAKIENLIHTISSSPLTSSNPQDYVKEHQNEFNELVLMDTKALSYMFAEFEKNDGTNIARENSMMLACRKILGNEDITYTAARGVHWYYVMKDYMISRRWYLNSYEYVRKQYPKASLILDVSNGVSEKPVSNVYYKQVMEHMANEHRKIFSPHYDVIDHIPSNYKETIDGDNFEATFLYKEIYKNYYKDPDTVGYIKEAKERGDKSYQVLYDEYNMPKEGNYDFRVTAKILPDKTLDMKTFALYTNASPKGVEWQLIKGFSEFIGGGADE